MSRVVPSALVLALLAPAAARANDLEAAFAKLRGTWVQVEQNGLKPGREFKLIVTKTNEYRMGGTSGDASDIAMLAGATGSIRLDPARTPPHIDLVGSKMTLRGLYKLEGERLVFILGAAEGARPTSFDKGDGVIHVFQREEEKK